MMLTRTIIALSLAVYALSAPPQKRAGILGGVGDLKRGLVPDLDSLLSSVGNVPAGFPASLPAGLPAGLPGLGGPPANMGNMSAASTLVHVTEFLGLRNRITV